MSALEALILGLLQGLTEFLPISSSGHIEIGKALLGIEEKDNLLFMILVHGATVLSTVVVFWKELLFMIREFFKFKWNEETQFIVKIFISMIPLGIIGIAFKDSVDHYFEGHVILVGWMFIVTAVLLYFTNYVRANYKPVGFGHSLIIGIAQAIAILPGISRSGATIATALLLGIEKDRATRFAFLMIIIPMLGATVLEIRKISMQPSEFATQIPALFIGFMAAFIAGIITCKWMISVVRRGKIAYFAIYCALIGVISIAGGYLVQQ